MTRARRRLPVWVALLYVGVWLTNRSLRRVEGGSMRPTLVDGELVLVLPTWLVAPRRGALVVVPDPREPRRLTIKRVAALAGGTVRTDAGELRAGVGQLLVLGDDPAASTDSRTYGPVAVADVRAVAVLAVRGLRRLDRQRGGEVDQRRTAP